MKSGLKMRKIAIANRKGGVGKTTTAVNVAAGLAMAGIRTLLIDTDSQGHCSRSLGADGSRGLADLLEGQEVNPIEVRSNLYLISGGRELVGSVRLMARENISPERVLSNVLKRYENEYDFVLLDTGPGFTEMSINVLFYADELLIPVSMEFLAMDGLISFLEEIDVIKKHKAVNIKYVVPTFLDGRVKKTTEIMDQLKDHFKDALSVPIRYSVKLSESPAWGKTIFEYAPRSTVAVDYAKLVKAIA